MSSEEVRCQISFFLNFCNILNSVFDFADLNKGVWILGDLSVRVCSLQDFSLVDSQLSDDTLEGVQNLISNQKVLKYTFTTNHKMLLDFTTFV